MFESIFYNSLTGFCFILPIYLFITLVTTYWLTITWQDHYILVKEPGSEYIGHINALGPDHDDVVEDTKAEAVAEQILESLRERGVDLSKITTLGCDGCVLNTGHEGGINMHLEKKLGRRLNWCSCMLHLLGIFRNININWVLLCHLLFDVHILLTSPLLLLLVLIFIMLPQN